MGMTDPIADFLTRLRNAAKAQHQDVSIPSSKLKRELARILKEQGYIDAYEIRPPAPGHPGEQISITLKYTEDRKPVISGMERVTVNGPKGELWERIHRDINVEQVDDQIRVTRPTDRGEHRALHGLTRSLVANMVTGVTDGFEKRLEIQGVGYRAQLRGRDLELALGYSHPVSVKAPDGIEFEVPQPTRIVVRGASKQRVGEVAAYIRKQRKPEPYKGKGIRYEGEYVARKVGKRARP